MRTLALVTALAFVGIVNSNLHYSYEVTPRNKSGIQRSHATEVLIKTLCSRALRHGNIFQTKMQQYHNLRRCIPRQDPYLDDLLEELKEISHHCGNCGKTRPYCDLRCISDMLVKHGFTEELIGLNKCMVTADGNEDFNMVTVNDAINLKLVNEHMFMVGEDTPSQTFDFEEILNRVYLGFRQCPEIRNFQVLPYLDCLYNHCTSVQDIDHL